MAGWICPDVARSADDFAKCREMIQKLDPSGIIPPMGTNGNVTYVIRDEDDRSKIMAMIHVETAREVRSMLVDPQYSHSQVSFTVLHRGMELDFRKNNVPHYFFTAPKANKRVISIFEKDGAQVIDTDVVRFVKRL